MVSNFKSKINAIFERYRHKHLHNLSLPNANLIIVDSDGLKYPWRINDAVPATVR